MFELQVIVLTINGLKKTQCFLYKHKILVLFSILVDFILYIIVHTVRNRCTALFIELYHYLSRIIYTVLSVSELDN